MTANSQSGRLRGLHEAARLCFAFCFLLFAEHAKAQAAGDNPFYRESAGLGVYLGIVPAAILRAHPDDHPEAGMHGGPAGGTHRYHVVIAIFDVKTSQRVTDATATLAIRTPGQKAAPAINLERMDIADAPTFGAFVDLNIWTSYELRFDIVTPGMASAPASVSFRYEHLPQYSPQPQGGHP